MMGGRRFLILLAGLLVPATKSAGQDLIPPPPIFKGAPGQPDHQAIQNESEPWLAYDFATHRNLRWLCDKGIWIDTQTSEPLGYDGFRGENGDVIPPPPVIYDATLGEHQATQSIANPTHAFDSRTLQNLSWDSAHKTWTDSRTGKSVGFKGRLIRKCGVRDDEAVFERALMKSMSRNYRWFGSIDYEYRNFYKWKEVSGNSSSVVTNDVTSVTNGIGAWAGTRLWNTPLFGMVGGYYAGGLETDAMLLNGHRSHNDVRDYGYGAGARLFFGEGRRVSGWAWAAGMYEIDKGTHTEFDKSNTLIFTEDRWLKSWSGEYGVGATFWIQPWIGLDFGASYHGRFKTENADENLRLSTGLVLRLGER